MTPWPRADLDSSPNLESFSNQLSKFGYCQTHKRVLTDSWLPTDSGSLTPDRLASNPQTVSMKFIGWWHQVPIWRAVQISSPILVTNRLLMNGPWQATDRPLMDSKTPQLIFTSSLWNPEGPQDSFNTTGGKHAQMYLQLPLRQWVPAMFTS